MRFEQIHVFFDGNVVDSRLRRLIRSQYPASLSSADVAVHGYSVVSWPDSPFTYALTVLLAANHLSAALLPDELQARLMTNKGSVDGQRFFVLAVKPASVMHTAALTADLPLQVPLPPSSIQSPSFSPQRPTGSPLLPVEARHAKTRRIRRAGAIVMALVLVAALSVTWHSQDPSSDLPGENRGPASTQGTLPDPELKARAGFARLASQMEQLRTNGPPGRTGTALEALQGFKAVHHDHRSQELDQLIATWEGFQVAEARLTEHLQRLDRSNAPGRDRAAHELIDEVMAEFPGFDLSRHQQHAKAIEALVTDQLALASGLTVLKQSQDWGRSSNAIRLLADFQSKYPERDTVAIAQQTREWQALGAADLQLNSAVNAAASEAIERMVAARILLAQTIRAFSQYTFTHFKRRLSALETAKIAELERDIETATEKRKSRKKQLAQQKEILLAAEITGDNNEFQRGKNPSGSALYKMYDRRYHQELKRQNIARVNIKVLSQLIKNYERIIDNKNSCLNKLIKSRKYSNSFLYSYTKSMMPTEYI